MPTPSQFLTLAAAAKRLGVSARALRLYEARGLLSPGRTSAGWRSYGPDEMKRAGEIVALRALGFSLTQITNLLAGDSDGLEEALAAQQANLEGRIQQVSDQVERVRRLRRRLAGGQAQAASRLVPARGAVVSFTLPWPWGGERFELHNLRPLTYIVGPLFSGKTRLAQRLAEELPDGAFLGLDRLEDGGAASLARLVSDAALKVRVERTMACLLQEGATSSDALLALVAALEDEASQALVVDMVEQGLDEATQRALMAHLRRTASDRRPLFLMTRSSVILELDSLGSGEAILFCPANHSPPMLVAPYPGAPGYEAVASCLAAPEVRARSEGVIAVHRPAA